MAKINFTAGRVADFICPADRPQAFLWDSKAPGLGLRATVAGAKSYIFQAKLAGKTLRITIGNPRSWTISQAQEEARRLQTLVDEGRDPRQVKAEKIAADQAKRQEAKRSKAPALDAWNLYIEARTPKWGVRHRESHIDLTRKGGEPITRGLRAGMSNTKQPGMLRALLEKPLREITRDEVAAWLEAERPKHPSATRRALACLKAFIAWASDRTEYRNEVNADACDRLARELPPINAKNDCLQREQLAAWFKAVRDIPNFTVSAYLQILLLSGARRNELAQLRWDEVDFRWRSIILHDKVEEQRTIGITPYVEHLLCELEKLNQKPLAEQPLRDAEEWKPSPWVFSSKTAKGGRLQEPRKAHNKAIEAANLPSLSIHGLRRSFGTLAEWVECPAGISAQIMGHKPSALAEKHYRRRPLDLLRQWHTQIEGWILDQAGIALPLKHEQPQGQD